LRAYTVALVSIPCFNRPKSDNARTKVEEFSAIPGV
jgi:hypothetical protein